MLFYIKSNICRVQTLRTGRGSALLKKAIAEPGDGTFIKHRWTKRRVPVVGARAFYAIRPDESLGVAFSGSGGVIN